MIEWYTTVLNTGHCELTPLMTMSIYGPFGIALMIFARFLGNWKS